jgi:hypothetical protein
MCQGKSEYESIGNERRQAHLEEPPRKQPRSIETRDRAAISRAIMTDREFAKVLVREVQDQMFAFDADRARAVIRMLVDDAPAAESAFTAMLRDMRSR